MEILSALRCFTMMEKIPDLYKESPSDFTRSRKLPFGRVLILLLRKSGAGIQNGLDALSRALGLISGAPADMACKSAFCQQRQKMKPEAVKAMNALFVKEFYTENDENVGLWRGYRLLAVDGSVIDLPACAGLKSYLAKTGEGTLRPMARVSALYDPINKVFADVSLSATSVGERALALAHLKHCAPGKDLILYDRGYPSAAFIGEHLTAGVDFVMRAPVGFNGPCSRFIASGAPEAIAVFADGKHKWPVRLVRVELPSGPELLITSLMDMQEYPHGVFKPLYALRWGIETRYDVLKNTLVVENFSGRDEKTVLQDFYGSIMALNLQALFENGAKEVLQEGTGHRRLRYQTNTSLSVGFLRDRMFELFSGRSPKNLPKSLKTSSVNIPNQIGRAHV